MVQMTIDLDPKYDKLLNVLKAEKEYVTKTEVAVKVIMKFFDENMKLD